MSKQSLRIAINVDPEPFVRKFQQLQGHLDGDEIARFLDKSVVPYLHDRAKKRFASEGDGASGAWQELADRTQADRYLLAQKHGWPIEPDHPINRRSGELRTFITTTRTIRRTAKGPTLYIPRLGSVNPKLSSKFKVAQKGASISRKNPNGSTTNWEVPARPVIAVDEYDMRAIKRRWSRWVGKVLKTI